MVEGYRGRGLERLRILQVRIMSTSEGMVRVTEQLDPVKLTTPDQCWWTYPDELHFEESSFEAMWK